MRGLLALVAVTAAGASPAITVSDERNVSRAQDDQAEVAIAADPHDPNVLLGSSGGPVPMRTYSSTDGGKTWSSATDVPNTLLGDLPVGDPAPAIDAAGRQYLAFVAASPLTTSPHYGVVTRDGPGEDWQPTNRPILDERFQDKPILAVDNAPDSPHPGRLYLGGVEFRVGRALGRMVLTHSDDRGQTWSSPVTLTTGRSQTIPQFLTLAVGRGGVVYAGWFRFEPFRAVVRLSVAAGAWAVPAQTIPSRGERRPVTATPLLRVDTTTGPFADRVYLSYEDRRAAGRMSTCSVSLPRSYRSVAPSRSVPRRREPIAFCRRSTWIRAPAPSGTVSTRRTEAAISGESAIPARSRATAAPHGRRLRAPRRGSRA